VTDEKKVPPPEWLLALPCWGIFDIDGNWRPNPYLQIDADEQRRQNIENGHMTAEGKRIPMARLVDWWQN
jgi:hypothetical protein